ncbi:MAG: hypothetical protein PHX83_06425 [Acidobacteriia bacterium]|nr:hypothetical protein [Terriglobia bacterium]
MKLSVELTQEKEFRIRSGKNVFVCQHVEDPEGRWRGLTPVEIFIAALGSSIASCALNYCELQSLAAEGLAVGMEWEMEPTERRIEKITGSIHIPEAVTAAGREDEFMSAAHTSEIYHTLLVKPEMHFHPTHETEKPEGEALLHFVGAE